MATFRCRVADGKGRIGTMVRAAASPEAVSRELSAEELHPVSIEEVPSDAGGRLGRLARALVREFTDTLSTLLAAGLSVPDALSVQQTVFDSREGARLIAFLLARIERGDPLSSALSELGRSFPAVYRGLVGVGERIGSLAEVMARLSVYLRKRKQVRDKLLGSLAYPAIVLVVAIAGVLVIATVVLPQARVMFEELGTALPSSGLGAVRSLAAVSIIAVCAAGAAVLVVSGLAVARKTGASAAVDRFVLRLPVVGPVVLRQEVLNFTFAMEILTDSGVTVESALREAACVLHNFALRDATIQMAQTVTAGVPLSAGFAGSGVFPRRLAAWARIGERTGDPAGVFRQVRAYYENEVDRWIDRFMTLIEPALIVVVGAAVLILVATLVLPLFGLIGNAI